MGEKRARGSVAVVIPCFNDGATLVEAVASAQNQELPAEVIVVDDGSTESTTIAVTERLEASGVRVLHQVNQGPAPARMAGVRATEADYVFPLDADDLIAPGGLKRLANVLDRHPEAAERTRDARGALPGISRPACPAHPRRRSVVRLSRRSLAANLGESRGEHHLAGISRTRA